MVKLHDGVKLVLKLSGVGFIVFGVVSLSTFLPFLSESLKNSDSRVSVVAYVAQMFVPLLFGVFLWLFPARITDTIVKPDSPAENTDALLTGLERIGITLMGLYLLYRGISDLTYQIINYYNLKSLTPGAFISPRYDIVATFVATGIELVVALVFIFGAKGILRIIRRFRYAGEKT